MRYALKQRLLSWGGDFTIKDDKGRDVYFVDQKIFRWGKQLSFEDLKGNELLFIRQRLLSWGPRFEISQAGEVVATVTGSASMSSVTCSSLR